MILTIPLEAVELDGEGCHLFVKAKLNSKAANLLLDTGASKTVFDLSRIGKFIGKKKKSFEPFENTTTGLGTNKMQSHLTIIDEFCIDELKLANFQAILLDMKHVNRSYRLMGLPAIDGVLGSDMLMKYKGVIDFEKGILKLKI